MNKIYDPIDNPFSSSISDILGIIQAVGVSVAIIMLVYIGIKFIMTSPEGKADVKRELVPYLIGCILLFAGTTLIGIIANIAYTEIK